MDQRERWPGDGPLPSLASLGPAYQAVPPWIALTFDDGPSATCTAQVLDVLARWQATATFFVLGLHARCLGHLVRRAADQGHTVGSHGYSHRGLRPVWDVHALRWELERNREVLWQAAGVETARYRAPYGRTTPWTRRWLRQQGWTLVGWDLCPRDWTRPSPEALARRVLRCIRPGSIVLLHDGDPETLQARRENTVRALPLILGEGTARGYRFVSLEEAQRFPTPAGDGMP